MSRILLNFDVASLYPNIVRIFGYSSRNQQDKNKYVETLQLRLAAKHKEVPTETLEELDVTNDDLKVGLKLPINAYTGALRATFNPLYDPVQGFSICTTGQLLILQLIYDLQKIPTVEMVSANTDAVMFTIEEEHKSLALDVLTAWQKHTGLELEEDNIVKIIMRDVNNYCEIVQTGDNDYKVNYKGGEFKGNHKFKWDKENKVFKYSFDDDVEANSMTIISEALLKNLLFNTPLEKTINNCNDIFRFQIITHLGHTYEKIVQESPNGDIELQRNNRIYAGKKPSGLLVKIKSNGRRDSLASCPTNPIVDNDNHCTIDDVDKNWYVKIARQKLNDFKGVKRLEDYKKEELIEKAISYGLPVDKKMKKVDIIEMIVAYEDEHPVENLYVEHQINKEENEMETKGLNVYQKINEIKKEIMKMDFVMDEVMPTNLGGGEYASIGQYYKAINEMSIKYNLLFTWDVCNVVGCERDLFKPQGKPPQHVWTVECIATFIDPENKDADGDAMYVKYYVSASGSDICDKGVSGASSLAFRNWFDKNFTPKHIVIDEFVTATEVGDTNEKTSEPKVPTYIPAEKKEEIKKEVVATEQHEDSDEEDAKRIITKIMKVRELSNNPTWATPTLDSIMSQTLSTADLLAIELKVDNKLDTLKG